MTRAVEAHWRGFRPLAVKLAVGGRTNQSVLALLATESFFRDRIDRMLELASWAFLDMMGAPAAMRISVGLAQVQVRHWRRVSGSRPWRTIRALRTFSDPRANYDACRDFVASQGMLAAGPIEVLGCYTGRVTRHHLEVFEANRRLAAVFNTRPRPKSRCRACSTSVTGVN